MGNTEVMLVAGREEEEAGLNILAVEVGHVRREREEGRGRSYLSVQTHKNVQTISLACTSGTSGWLSSPCLRPPTCSRERMTWCCLRPLLLAAVCFFPHRCIPSPRTWTWTWT